MPDQPPGNPISFTSGTSDTVLAAPEPDALRAMDDAMAEPPERRRAALGAVAARWPAYLEVWAALADDAQDVVDQYAFARVGYHRGLDALRAAGWRGTGFVRWSRAENRGFLRSLDALRRAAAAIGEDDEADRCRVFLAQLDPDRGEAHT